MKSNLMQRLLIGFGVAGLLLIALAWIVTRSAGPDIESVASASLKGMREQNRLTAFAANYSAVVTSEQKRFGLTARKTLIMQGMVRYEVDLSKLPASDAGAMLRGSRFAETGGRVSMSLGGESGV